ncbi:MAG: glycosyltransferase family 4 protein, partial [Anaerolineales bacterium]
CPSGAYTQAFKEMGIEWVKWDVNRQIGPPWQELGSILRLAKIYREHKPRILHAHTLKAVLYASLASFFAHTPRLVNSIAGRGHVYSSNKPLYVILRPVLNVLFWATDHILAPTWIFENQDDLEYFAKRKLTTRGKVHLIESVGVDLDLFKPAPEPQGVPTIFFAGRMLWSKGIGDLLEIVKTLKRQGVDVKCVLAGEVDPGNPDSIDTQTLEQWNRNSELTWVGWQRETSDWYQRSNLVVFPTKYGEGVPTVLLEAAASGRAIVAANHPGCAAVVEHGVNGLLVPPGDIPAFTAAVSLLLADPALRQKMGAAGRAIAEERFSKESVNRGTAETYNLAIA